MKRIATCLVAAVLGSVCVPDATPASAATETVLYSFQGIPSDGTTPVSMLLHNGILYGTLYSGGTGNINYCANVLDPDGCGAVFALDLSNNAETLLYSFCNQPNCTDGAGPQNLIDARGVLYGTTAGGGANKGGTLFLIDPKRRAETVLYSFCRRANCTDGVIPEGLIDVRGTLYGATAGGGNTNTDCYGHRLCGTVFSLDPKTGKERVIYPFCSQDKCTDGSAPSSGLIEVNGMLYGTTYAGGTGHPIDCPYVGCGTVFSIDPKTGTKKTVYSFCSRRLCADGAYPSSNLIEENGMLYGTTQEGGLPHGWCGDIGCGTVFSINPETGAEKILYAFCALDNCDDGMYADSNLVMVNGLLYGTTEMGGTGVGVDCNTLGCGTVFSVDPKTRTESVVYSFCGESDCADGAWPITGLISANGVLYGTTQFGGTANNESCLGGGCGTVFSITP